MTHNSDSSIPPSLTTAMTQHQHHEHNKQDKAISHLFSLLKYNNIVFSPLIAPHRFPASGLGIQALQPISGGTELVHVPADVLIIPSTVPDFFISHQVRTKQKLRNHAVVAAWLAFGPLSTSLPGHETRIEQPTAIIQSITSTTPVKSNSKRKRPSTKPEASLAALHQAWLATWPTLDALTLGTPVCWPPSAHAFLPFSTLVALNQRLSKLQTDWTDISRLFPQHFFSATPNTSRRSHRLFLHAWLCVNTRCFYFVPPGTNPPDDADEAFALCPVIDLWNHQSHSVNVDVKRTCDITHSAHAGFRVVTSGTTQNCIYPAGTELQTTYGPHTNDVLWVEYGFMLSSMTTTTTSKISPPPAVQTKNEDDHIALPDSLVLNILTPSQVQLLDTYGYKGGYTLSLPRGPDGRTLKTRRNDGDNGGTEQNGDNGGTEQNNDNGVSHSTTYDDNSGPKQISNNDVSHTTKNNDSSSTDQDDDNSKPEQNGDTAPPQVIVDTDEEEEGTCYRLQMTSYLPVLSHKKWIALVTGVSTVDELTALQKRRARGLRTKWIRGMVRETERYLASLIGMDEGVVLDVFGGSDGWFEEESGEVEYRDKGEGEGAGEEVKVEMVDGQRDRTSGVENGLGDGLGGVDAGGHCVDFVNGTTTETTRREEVARHRWEMTVSRWKEVKWICELVLARMDRTR